MLSGVVRIITAYVGANVPESPPAVALTIMRIVVLHLMHVTEELRRVAVSNVAVQISPDRL